MKNAPILLNQRQMAEVFDVSKNTLANWRLPRSEAESAKGTEVFYDFGICMHIMAGRELGKGLKRLKDRPSDLEALALGYVLVPGDRTFSAADTRRFLKLAARGGFGRDDALLALGMAAQILGVKTKGLSLSSLEPTSRR